MYYATGSGDILAENFNPAWFLLEKHRFSSFEVCVINTFNIHTVFVKTIKLYDGILLGAEERPGQTKERSEEE